MFTVDSLSLNQNDRVSVPGVQHRNHYFGLAVAAQRTSEQLRLEPDLKPEAIGSLEGSYKAFSRQTTWTTLNGSIGSTSGSLGGSSTAVDNSWIGEYGPCI